MYTQIDDGSEKDKLEEMILELENLTMNKIPYKDASDRDPLMEQVGRVRDISFEANKKMEEMRAEILRKRVEKETKSKLVCYSDLIDANK